jgi:hypothetical protein
VLRVLSMVHTHRAGVTPPPPPREQAARTVAVVRSVLEEAGRGGAVEAGRGDGPARDVGDGSARDVGVVTPYSAQAALLRELLQVT